VGKIMDVIKEMLFEVMRDDSVTTVGLRDLLSQTVSPYGVYHANLPDNLVFTSGKKCITYFQLTGEYDTSMPRHNYSTMAKQETYQITVWGGDATTSNDKILSRIIYLLEGKHKTTDPTTEAMVFSIKCEWEGPDQYDTDYRIFHKSARFRVWLQDCSIVGD
jgi:hypothetical protein